MNWLKVMMHEPIDVSDSDSGPLINWWTEALGLCDTDREILLSQSELTDNINAAQILLSTQFPSIGGFQNTLWAASSSLSLYQGRFQVFRFITQV